MRGRHVDRLQRDRGGVIRLRVFDEDGAPADAPSTPVVTLVDGAGVAVSTGTATRVSVGCYDFVLTAANTAQCDTLDATWTSTGATFHTTVEVIGSWPVSLAQLRAGNTELADLVRYPAALLRAARDLALDRMETACQVAWSTRRARATLDGDGSGLIILPHSEVQQVLALTVDGTAWAPGDCKLWPWGGLAAPDGQTWVRGLRNITVDYLHGAARCPAPVADAVVELAIGACIEYGTRVPERATSMSTEVGTFRLTIPGRDGPTGIPRVDAVIAQYGYVKPAIG